MSKKEIKKTSSSKKVFMIWLICAALYLVLAITGIAFTFVYQEALGLYQSLIVGGVMVVMVVIAVFTTLSYNKMKNDTE